MSKSRVEIPEYLSLKPYFTRTESQHEVKYELKSVVHHIGSTASSGHYTAHSVRHRGGQESAQWILFDDGIVTETKLDDVLSSQRSQQSAYMLLYACDKDSS